MDISKQLLHSTVRIEAARLDGAISTGTGFYFNFCVEGDRAKPAIVTNKHVVENANKMTIVFSVLDENGNVADKKEPLNVDGMLGRWIAHPDPGVDLCVLPIAPVCNAFEADGKRLAISPFSVDLIPNEGDLNALGAIEDVTMIGYPNGLWDYRNNLPIVRRGITATPAYSDYCGNKEFLVDMACYPGSSGSPVLLYNEGTYRTGDAISLGARLMLLGILYAVPVRDVEGCITVSDIPRVVSQGMLNLGFVIKAERLLDFEALI